jgi:hypothetical protein
MTPSKILLKVTTVISSFRHPESESRTTLQKAEYEKITPVIRPNSFSILLHRTRRKSPDIEKSEKSNILFGFENFIHTLVRPPPPRQTDVSE